MPADFSKNARVFNMAVILERCTKWRPKITCARIFRKWRAFFKMAAIYERCIRCRAKMTGGPIFGKWAVIWCWRAGHQKIKKIAGGRSTFFSVDRDTGNGHNFETGLILRYHLKVLISHLRRHLWNEIRLGGIVLQLLQYYFTEHFLFEAVRIIEDATMFPPNSRGVEVWG